MRRLVVALALLPISLGAQRQKPTMPLPDAWPAATQALDSFVAASHIVGGGLAFVRDGKVVAEHYIGSGDRDRHETAETPTIWHWGSITKTLTAIALMQQVERGKVSLDDPIVKWIPELRRVHSDYGPIDQITVRMLMSHSSGFQNPTWPWGKGEPWEPFEPTEWSQLVAMMPYSKLQFAPGSRYGYSNPAFIYLARIVEQVSGDPWEAYVAKNLFAPLGITTSYFGATPNHLARWRSNNYTVQKDGSVKANGRDFDPGITIPNGGWNAPIGDIAKWAGFLMGAAPGDSVHRALYEGILPRRSIETMWTQIVPAGSEAMGMSFFLQHEGDRRFVGHTGSQAGFRAFFYLDPDRRTSIIGVVNTDSDLSGTAYPQGFAASMKAGIDVLKSAPK
ncbi:MAG: serine hydrolase domain-containing protein [Gemmatimonadales bacterium]